MLAASNAMAMADRCFMHSPEMRPQTSGRYSKLQEPARQCNDIGRYCGPGRVRPTSENAAMAEQAFSTVIRGGTAVLPTGVARADIGIRGETIAAIGEHLGPGEREIDATGRLVAPGGVDPHAHIEQVSAGGLLNADSFESATVSAAFGGTTTVIPF